MKIQRRCRNRRRQCLSEEYRYVIERCIFAIILIILICIITCSSTNKHAVSQKRPNFVLLQLWNTLTDFDNFWQKCYWEKEQRCFVLPAHLTSAPALPGKTKIALFHSNEPAVSLLYQTILMTLKVIHLLQAFSNGIFSYNCASVDKVTTDIARRAVPLR